MMSVVKALKCNYPILRPTAWYWNSFVVGLGFLFQLWILYNTLHWSHLKDNRKKRQTCKTTNEFHFKVSDKLQPVERLFLWQYGVLKLEFVTSLFVLSTGEPKLFLFFPPPSHRTNDTCHLSRVLYGSAAEHPCMKLETLKMGTHNCTISYTHALSK